MYDGLARLLNDAAVDDRVVITVLTGAGDFYSSGNDIIDMIKQKNDGDILEKTKENCSKIRYGR
jgi:enoyl-CoA hydratase/carnithine racemase